MIYDVIVRINENSALFAEEYVTVIAQDIKSATEKAFVLVHNRLKDRYNCKRPIKTLTWSIDNLTAGFKYDYNRDYKDLSYIYHFMVTEVNVIDNGI